MQVRTDACEKAARLRPALIVDPGNGQVQWLFCAPTGRPERGELQGLGAMPLLWPLDVAPAARMPRLSHGSGDPRPRCSGSMRVRNASRHPRGFSVRRSISIVMRLSGVVLLGLMPSWTASAAQASRAGAAAAQVRYGGARQAPA